MEEIREIRIEGMHCDGCVRRVKAALSKLPNLTVEEVTVGLARVRGSIEDSVLKESIAKLGFEVRP